MASFQSRTRRNAAVRKRLEAVMTALGEQLGVRVPESPRPSRDRELQPIIELERFADFAESVLAAVDSEPSRAVGVEVEMPGIDDLVRYAADQYAARTGAEVPSLDVNGIAEVAVERWRDGWTEIEVDSAGEPEADVAGYGDLTVAELRDLLKERDVDVPSNARKADLIAVLEQADADAEAEADEGTEAGVEAKSDTDEGE